jgi:hypothetical protein
LSEYQPDLTQFGSLSLDELNGRAALLDRMENKYLLRSEAFSEVLADLHGAFDVLVIDDRRIFSYETIYFDTADFQSYHQHLQGKRRRFKIRTRRYVESDLYYFEVKLKGVRGRTVKKRMSISLEQHGRVTPEGTRFIRDTFASVYGERFEAPYFPRLAMLYRRLALVGIETPERVTVDFGFNFAGAGDARAAAPADLVIVEAKSERGYGAADRVMREHRVRGGSCNKYCVGLNLVRPHLRYNGFKRTLESYFEWSPGRLPWHEDALQFDPLGPQFAGVELGRSTGALLGLY